jgi:hypothetical protein
VALQTLETQEKTMKPHKSLGIPNTETRRKQYSKYMLDFISSNVAFSLKNAYKENETLVWYPVQSMFKDDYDELCSRLTKNGYAFCRVNDDFYIFTDGPDDVDIDKELKKESDRWDFMRRIGQTWKKK